jgi:hypothetical protein
MKALAKQKLPYFTRATSSTPPEKVVRGCAFLFFRAVEG